MPVAAATIIIASNPPIRATFWFILDYRARLEGEQGRLHVHPTE
jgi:hypothetical protein